MIDIFTEGYKITQGFGEENTSSKYLAWYQANNLKGHEGVDIIPKNKNMDWRIFSPISGEVVKANHILYGPYGRYVTIWNKKKNIAIQVCHMIDVKVNVGDKVEKNKTFIGVMGGSGINEESYPPHAHINGIPVNIFGHRNGDKKNGYKGLVNPLPYIMEG